MRNLVFGSAIALTGVLLAGCTSSSLDGGGDGVPSTARFGAFDVCKQFVSDRLKSPSTAKWRDPAGNQVTFTGDGKGPITVSASVDSENGFGAEIRSTYDCTVTNTDGDNWTLDNLNFQDGGDS